MKIDPFKKALSYITPVVIETRRSKYNTVISVILENGKLILNSKNANYSFGSLHNIFQVAFQKVGLKSNFKGKDILLLGTGGGSIPEIIFNELRLDCKITAVEIDPVIIELSSKYFHTGQFKKMEIVCADAYKFVSASTKKHDVIIVDLFIDLKVPKEFLRIEFLNQLAELLNEEGWLFFNFILNNPDETKILTLLEEHLKSLFKSTSMFTIGSNYIFTSRK